MQRNSDEVQSVLTTPALPKSAGHVVDVGFRAGDWLLLKSEIPMQAARTC